MIPLAEPNLTGREKEYVADAISSGWVSGGGPYVERFEEMIAEACGKKWAIATTTGTAALHAAMTVLEFSGTVEMPCYTFVAAKNVIENMGNIPVFYDNGDRIDYDTSVIFQEGNPGLAVVDSAPAIGAPLSPWGSVWTFSFNGNKTITTGQGGAIVGDDFNIGYHLRHLIAQKRVHGGRFNYRMPNINAAMGCAQMERLVEFLLKKSTIWQRYADAGLPMERGGDSRWMSLMKSNDCEGDIGRLNEEGIEARFLWNFMGNRYKDRQNYFICLPCSTTLTEDQQDKVIKACESLL